MKFVIKSGSVVKLFSGDVKIEALAQFLKENFTSWNSNNLTYTDKDGDKISITTQEDLDTLMAMNPNSQYAKLEVSEGPKDTNEEALKIYDKINSTEVTPSVENTNFDDKESTQPRNELLKEEEISKKGPTKWGDKKWREEKLKNIKEQKSERSKQKGSTSEESDAQLPKKEHLQKLQGLISSKIAQMVDQRIKNLIPCLKNQLTENFEVSSINESQSLKHEGIVCNGCSMNPIIGIRYKCLTCPTFNFCSTCQEKIQHDHNLLKMKKPEEKQETLKNVPLWKLGKKLLREMKNRGTSSQSEHEGFHHRHRHCRGKGKFRNQEDFLDHKMNKKMFKLKTIFGERQNFKQFIAKYSDLKPRELLELYAAENNISAEQFQLKRDQMRKAKLAAFYDCPQEEFDEVVKASPQLSFRDIIMKLRETGVRTYTGDNFKNMRQKFRRGDVEGDQSEEKVKLRQDKKSVSKPKERSKRKHSRSKQPKRVDRKAILASMKSLFGEQDTKKYEKFIDECIDLEQEEIIAKWIEKVTV